MSNAAEQSGGGQTIPAKMRQKHDAMMNLIEPFCREHLNDEYLGTCRRLAGLLARKRLSPLVNGTAAAWACGIVRTIGWVNFLDDNTRQPYMKMTDIDKAFGVSSGTGQAKSKTIRDLLKIVSFDTEWTLPSMMADNPMVWLIQVNGMIVDVRSMPAGGLHLAQQVQRHAGLHAPPGSGSASQPADRGQHRPGNLRPQAHRDAGQACLYQVATGCAGPLSRRNGRVRGESF